MVYNPGDKNKIQGCFNIFGKWAKITSRNLTNTKWCTSHAESKCTGSEWEIYGLVFDCKQNSNQYCERAATMVKCNFGHQQKHSFTLFNLFLISTSI